MISIFSTGKFSDRRRSDDQQRIECGDILLRLFLSALWAGGEKR